MKFPVHQVAKVTYPVQQLINSTVSTIATLLGWQIDPVADIAALATVEDARIADGSGKFVRTVMDTFHLDKDSTAVVDGITVVATMSGTGRWLRSGQPDIVWASQATWYINATTGDNENNGLTSGTALATWAEFRRRVEQHGARVAMTVYIETDLPAGDPINFVSSGSTITVQGVPVDAYEGTVSAWSRDDAANNPGTLADAGWTVADHVHEHIRFTSGALQGHGMWILQANFNGAGNARVSLPHNDTGWSWSDPTLEPTPTDTFVVETLPVVTVGSTAITYNGSFLLSHLEFRGWSAFGFSFARCAHLGVRASKILLWTQEGSGTLNLSNCIGAGYQYAQGVLLYAGAYKWLAANRVQTVFEFQNTVTVDAAVPSYTDGLELGKSIVYEDIWFWSSGAAPSYQMSILSDAVLDTDSYSNPKLRGVTNATILISLPSGAKARFLNLTGHTVTEKTVRFVALATNVELDTGAPVIDQHTGTQLGVFSATSGGSVGIVRTQAFGIKGALVAGDTRYALTDLTASASEVPVIVTNRSFARNLRAYVTEAPGNNESVVITVYINGAPSTITCTISGTNTAAIDVTNVAAVAPDDRVSIHTVSSNNGGFTADNLCVSLEVG